MQALQENDMRLSSAYEVDEPSVAVHSIPDVCHVECPDGSTCFFDYNANVFSCNVIFAPAGVEKPEKEKEVEGDSSEWSIAAIPSTTARLNMHTSTVDEEEEVPTSTSNSGQVFDVSSDQSEITESPVDDLNRGLDVTTTTSETPGIVPASAEDEDPSVVDKFPETGREAEDLSVDIVTSVMVEPTTMPGSTIPGIPSTTTDSSQTDTSFLPESTPQPTEPAEDLISEDETTQKHNVEVDQSPVPHDIDIVPDAVSLDSGVSNTKDIDEVRVDSSTLSSRNETDIKTVEHISVEESATVAGLVPVETEEPKVTDESIEDVTTASPMTTLNPTESEFGTEITNDTLAPLEVVTRGPEADFTTVAEPGFVITTTSTENKKTEQTDVSTLRSLTEANDETNSEALEGVTQGFESIDGEIEAITEAQQRAEMTTRLSKVLTTTLQTITESILRDKDLIDEKAIELEEALNEALTEVSMSTSTTSTTEQSISSDRERSSVDLSIPIIKDPAEVEQMLQELVANVTRQFKVTTLAYDGATGVTVSPLSSALNEAVTMLVPGFVSTAATTEEPVPATATVTGGAVEEDELATATENAAVPRNLQLAESEKLHNALVTEPTSVLANECEAIGMFSCGNGCIRREKRCDLIMDCEDGSDETDCGE